MNAPMIATSDALRFERLLPGPPMRIWEYLTRPSLLATWLGEGEIELHVGGYVELKFSHREFRDAPAPASSISGVVTHCDPPESLAYYWTDYESISNVMFEIEPRGGEVLLLLTHARLPKPYVSVAREFWKTRLGYLEEQIRGSQSGIFVAFGERARASCER